MSDLSPRLALPYLAPGQAQKHVTHNDALNRLDLLVQLCVRAFGAETPPGAPEEGQAWALGPAPTGAWLGQGGRIAAWQGGGWVFLVPAEGWRAFGVDSGDIRVWNGNSWIVLPGPDSLQNLTYLGVGTTADATNRLAVQSAGSLFSHAGNGDHRMVVNKASPTDTASLLFQTGFSGRAEMGLAGADDFALKVSGDGTAWTSAVTVNRATGRVALPVGLDLGAQGSDPANPGGGWLWHNSAAGAVRTQLGGRLVSLGGHSLPVLVPEPGDLVGTSLGSAVSLTTFTGSANLIDLYPFSPGADLSVDAAVINVTTAVAGTEAKIVIYAADSRGRPGALLAETAALSCATTGAKTAILPPMTLWHGQTLWLGVRHSGAAAISATWPYNTPAINGGGFVTSARTVLRRFVTFASPAPASWGFSAAEISNGNPASIWLRIA